MAVETEADRLLFVDGDEFAVAVVWGASSFTAIFDAEYQLLVTPLVDGGVEGSGPQILARSSDIPVGAAQGDALTVDGRSYKAVEFKPDGTGMTTVRLQEA